MYCVFILSNVDIYLLYEVSTNTLRVTWPKHVLGQVPDDTVSDYGRSRGKLAKVQFHSL